MDGVLDPDRRAALEGIDPWRAPRWPVKCQRAYAAARAWWLPCGGRVEWPALPVDTRLRGRAGRLLGDRPARSLVAVGGGAAGAAGRARHRRGPGTSRAGPAKATHGSRSAASRADRFTLGVAALAQFAAREEMLAVAAGNRPWRQPVGGAQPRIGCRTAGGNFERLLQMDRGMPHAMHDSRMVTDGGGHGVLGGTSPCRGSTGHGTYSWLGHQASGVRRGRASSDPQVIPIARVFPTARMRSRCSREAAPRRRS